MSDTKERYFLIGSGCFVWLWTLARAALQSITIDEADGYLNFGAPVNWPNYWFASSGNHVLNSILQRLLASTFGMSQFLVRIPALAGAAVYLAACYLLCRRLIRTPLLRILIYACLILNPFVMDYLAAARGYSLALAFLMLAIWALLDARYALASLCAGISICANFSFAYMNVCLIAVFGIHAFLRTRNWRILLDSAWPAALTIFVICGQVLRHFPKSQIYYGAPHLLNMWQSIAGPLFDDLNPYLAHEIIVAAGEQIRFRLPAILALMLVWQVVRIVLAGHKFGMDLARSFTLAFLCHWLMFRVQHLPLPAARTALFFVPIAFLLIAIGLDAPGALLPRRIQIGVLAVSAIYFAFALRANYFNEWKFDADTRAGFDVVRDLAHKGAGPLYTNWRYSSAFNFYREYTHDYTLPIFEEKEETRPNCRVYTLHFFDDLAFIRENHLRVVYRGQLSDMAVAVRD